MDTSPSTTNVLVLSQPNGKDSSDDFAINENDYRVMTEIWSAITGSELEPVDLSCFRTLIEIAEDDEERRVWRLNIHFALCPWSLPTSIEFLRNLTHLKISSITITSIPDSIGNLAQLTELHLACYSMKALPPGIWRLQNLTSLHLACESMRSIPPGICRLQNLTSLLLTMHEIDLPEEVWDLANLEKLSLEYSDITSLSPSISKLRNLEVLDLSETYNLENLPEEIGNLASLKILDLHGSEIKCIPPSIEKLQNLRVLNISYNTTVSSDLLKKLTGLLKLEIAKSNVVHDNSQCEFLFKLVTHCPMLGELVADATSLTSEEITKVSFALACNRARYRTSSLSEDEESSGTFGKLLPHVLKNASSAFDLYHLESTNDEYALYSGAVDFATKCKVSQPDAIYQLLAGESLIVMLANRNSMDDLIGSCGVKRNRSLFLEQQEEDRCSSMRRRSNADALFLPLAYLDVCAKIHDR